MSPYFKERSSVDFEDHFAVLEHLHNELLPICDSSRHYEFIIEILFDASGPNAATNVIESLLQMPQIVVCSNVTIEVRNYPSVLIDLPVEAIAKWLNQKSDNPTRVIDQKNAKKQEKFLAIHLFEVHNELEVVDNLREVYFVYFIENSNNLKLKVYQWFFIPIFRDELFSLPVKIILVNLSVNLLIFSQNKFQRSFPLSIKKFFFFQNRSLTTNM